MADGTRGSRVRRAGGLTGMSWLSALVRGRTARVPAVAASAAGGQIAMRAGRSASVRRPPRASAAIGVTEPHGGTGPPQRDTTGVDGPQGEQAVVLAIVRRAQDGDSQAFGELYDRYVGLVFRYVYYRIGDRSRAEDFTSETFLRALRRISTYTWQGRDFGAWLVTIARNLMADHFKSSRFRLEVTTDDLGDADRRQDGPEGAVVQSLCNDELLAAVKELGAEQQECIVLRFLQGLSVAETAQVMGKNDGAIKAMQYRAVRALARRVPPDLLG
jgi:RNA polymerase sigma-70 factor (ECF subfamily)